MAKKTINTGTAANAGNGDTLRDAMGYINDNFTELYNRLGPCNTSKAANFEMQLAIKSAQINLIYQSELIYISKIVCGTESGGNYTYTIEINAVSGFTAAGTKICAVTSIVGTAKTGLELVLVGQNAGSGRFVYLGINWSLLTLGTTYTAANYPEGALFCPVLAASVWSGGGDSDGMVQVIADGDDSQILDGSKSLYIFTPTAGDISAHIAAVANIKGQIVIINSGASGKKVNIAPSGAEITINGVASTIDINNTSGQAGTGGGITIIPYDGNLIAVNMTDSTLEAL